MDVERCFNDDFTDIFNDSDMKVDDDGDIQQFISLLGAENTLDTRYENICNVVYKCLHKTSVMELEEKVFQHLMPAIRDLFDCIFKEIANTLNATGSQRSATGNLKILRDCILMCLGSYEVLDCILKNLLGNDVINLYYIQSVPVNFVNILLVTFQHCKQSAELYNNYFHELKEIIQLFQSAQDIHSKLLQLLISHTNFDGDQQIVLLKDVLFILGDISEVLVDMNLKTLADNWKGYMTLIEKYSHVLNVHNFSTDKPLKSITLLIKQNLDKVLKMNESEQKIYTPVLKMCKFFIQIVIKLCNLFWQQGSQIHHHILLFFSSMHRFLPSYLYFKGYCDDIIDGIDQLIIKNCDPLIKKCLLEGEFIKAFSEIDINEYLNSPGGLFFILDLFSKLRSMDHDAVNTIEVHILIDVYFKVIKECYVELFWTIQTVPKSSIKQSVFEESFINVSKVIQLLDHQQYQKVEFILMNNILQPNIWNALAAVEIWQLVLRNKPELTYKTMLSIVGIANPILQNPFTCRPEKVFIQHLLRQLYTCLPEEQRIELIEKYPISTNLKLWRFITLNELPVTYIVFIESLLISVIENVEDFKNGKCSVTDFHFLCDSFDAIAGLSMCTQIDLTYLILTVLKLWDFDPNSGYVQNNSLLKYFLKKLFNVTSSFILNLTGEQLLFVLSRVKELSSTCFQLEILLMLQKLSPKSLHQFPEKNQIVTVLSSIFNVMYTDPNPIIKEIFLETFVHFLNTTPHEEILQNVAKTNQELQFEITNFIQKNIVNQGGKQILSGDDYFAKQKCYTFQHKCLEFALRPKMVDTDDGKLNALVKRIKCDLESLFRLTDKQFVENRVSDIVNGFT